MPRASVPPALVAEVKQAMISTSEKILQSSQGDRLGDVAVIRELYKVLKIATRRVANLLNESTPTHRLPQEVLTRILFLAVDHGSKDHAKQTIPLTHVCRYWRMLLLSYPRMWTTLYMNPGSPSTISEWLARSQNAPLTIITEFNDAYDHPPCRYKNSATATLANTKYLDVCPRHTAILSLDQLLPHRSRIHDLSVLFRSSDPDWADDGHDSAPLLLSHRFFMETLPNLQRLDFRATHVEQERHTIRVPSSLFAGKLPRLKELKYLGVADGLIETAKNLVTCKIGWWAESAGPTIISQRELRTLFDNNKTVRSLSLTDCEISAPGHRLTTITPMTDLKFLKIHCYIPSHLEIILKSIQIPQFENLDTVKLSLSSYLVQVVATDGSGHTFEFRHATTGSSPNFFPLRHLGADVTTLRLCGRISHTQLDEQLGLYEFFWSLDAVRELEFDGTIDSVDNILSNVVSMPGVFLGLKVIRVAVGLDDCEEVIEYLTATARLRMEEGNPLAVIEPFSAEGLGERAGSEGGLSQELRAEWEKRYEAKGVQNFLSG